MPKVSLYCVRDFVACDSGPVFGAVTDGIAIRQACILLRDVVDIDDYGLFCVGTYDSETMRVDYVNHREVAFKFMYANFMAKMEELKARNTYVKEVE